MQIMGILNLTPDSFSDGGKFFTLENALKHADKLISDGADILDLGAESTRPNFQAVSAEEEMRRLLPALCEIRKAFPKIKISVDTYKGSVARAALREGADIINDIWGGLYQKFFKTEESSTLQIAAEFSCPIILMHNRTKASPIADLNTEIFSDFERIISNAKNAGLSDSQIILDGGFGFGKTHAQNIEMVHNYSSLREFGYPLLLGLSRKSSLREFFGAENADNATLAFDFWAAAHKSCDFIRVHDVASHKVFLNSLSTIENTKKWTK